MDRKSRQYQRTSPLRIGIKKTREANPCATLQQIGEKYGVTRERVRQILAQEQLPTAAIVRKKRIYCLNCDKEIPRHNTRFCNRECQQVYHTIEVICSQCDKVFLLKQSQLIARVKRNISGLIFCSNRCNSKWLGTNYGCGSRKNDLLQADN